MNRKTVIFVLVTFLLLLVIGYLLNNQRYLNSRLSSLPSISSKQQLFLTPTSAYKNQQKFEDLIWKKYYSQNLGVSFEYPENLEFVGPEKSSSLIEKENGIQLASGFNYIFSIYKKLNKLSSNESIEEYLKKISNEPESFKVTKTSFRNKIAYYVEDKQFAQVPSDNYYIFLNDDYYLFITFAKRSSLRHVAESACLDREDIIKNECDANMLYQSADYYERFSEFDNLIINRILNSIEFIK